MKTIVGIEGMTCQHCVMRVDSALKSVPGAKGVKVDLKKKQATLDAGSAEEAAIRAAVADAGYSVTSVTEGKGGFSLFAR